MVCLKIDNLIMIDKTNIDTLFANKETGSHSLCIVVILLTKHFIEILNCLNTTR